ncbi:MAG: phenylacetate--CoA ligase family protein [Dokdonella sp.]|uniref:phenylacetate--CoA ligase family protein n=1 Tax=Dokdonella sp. TaxID=2291710 RepID=UPI00326457D7
MSLLYERLFQRVLFPFYESLLRRRKTIAYGREYDRNQWLSADALAALQWTRLKALLDHCYREVPYYRRLWDALGITPDAIRSMEDYARLPILTKADIRANFDDLIAPSYRAGLLLKSTGGSTGEPLRFGYTRESHERRTAVMWRGYGWAGARMGRRTLYLWGGTVGNPGRLQLVKDRLFHAAFGRRMLDSFPMSESNMAQYADAIDAYKPEVMVGYVGPLVRLAQWLLAHKRQAAAPHSILGGAEALLEYQRELIQRAFGAPAYNTYGCREFMLIASECERRDGLHINADHLLVEAGRAEPGDVLITDLHNYGMPFIRYANGDLATTSTRACACGRGLPMLERVDGRKLDAIRTRTGQILPGEFFPHMLKDVPGVVRFQVVQRTLETLDISIVRGDAFDAAGLDYARNEIAKQLGDALDVRFHFVDAIETGKNGKFRVTISELSADASP